MRENFHNFQLKVVIIVSPLWLLLYFCVCIREKYLLADQLTKWKVKTSKKLFTTRLNKWERSTWIAVENATQLIWRWRCFSNLVCVLRNWQRISLESGFSISQNENWKLNHEINKTQKKNFQYFYWNLYTFFCKFVIILKGNTSN